MIAPVFMIAAFLIFANALMIAPFEMNMDDYDKPSS